MGWWLDRYLASLNEGKTLPNASVTGPDPLFVYAALAFDRAGVAPGLASRFQVLALGDVLRVEDAVGLVAVALGHDGYGVSGGWTKRGRDQTPDGAPVVFAADYNGGKVRVDPRLLSRGSLTVVESADLVVVEGVLAGDVDPLKLADRAEVLGASFGPAEAAEMARVLYAGEHAPTLPPDFAVSITLALVAVARATTAEDFFRELDDLWRRRQSYDASEEPASADGKPALPKSSERKEADRVAGPDLVDVSAHKPLSQMSGFGEAGEWGVRLAEDLRAYAQGELDWSEVDKGMLVTSPPGGGKSTFARALAAECGVSLYVSTYGNWEGRCDNRSYVVGAMTKLFDAWRVIARDGGPIIVFIDEIDSVGARGGNGHNESWFAAIINGMLAFLDGAVPRDGVVVVAATNFPDRVDPALKRPGRLDRVVAIPRPDEAALAGIVAHHLNVPADAPDTKAAARALRGRSPAEVEQACREARRMGRTLKREVDASDLVDLLDWSRPKVHPRQDRLVRVHESGHAVVALALEAEGWRLTHVDAHPSGRGEFVTGGSVMTSCPPWNPTRAGAVREIAQLLGGMAAERTVIGETCTGSESDLEKATWIAARLVRHCGMGETLTHLSEKSPLSREDGAQIEALLREGLDLAVRLVSGWKVRVLAEMLKDRPFMTGDEVRSALKAWHREAFFRERGEEMEVFEYRRMAA